MRTQTRARENDRQQDQTHRSASRMFGMWVTSDAGDRLWVRLAGFAFGMFMFSVGLQAGKDEWSQRTYEATVANRCLGVEILAHLEPSRWTLPAWCPSLLERMRDELPRGPGA